MQPLHRGTVIFTPDGGKGNDSQHEPRGPIDGEGNYQLSTTDRLAPSVLAEGGGLWRVAVPRFSVSPGTYETEQTVLITSGICVGGRLLWPT